ncbi:unnamed protein product [Cochlearia groenlandica]
MVIAKDDDYQQQDLLNCSQATKEDDEEEEEERNLNDGLVQTEPVKETRPVQERESVRERERIPEWLVKVMREAKGAKAKFIMNKEKGLTMSDVENSQARLLIPFKKIKNVDFLYEEELLIIDQHFNKNRDKGLDVIFIDSTSNQWNLNLRRWDMTSSSNYVLVSGWSQVIDDKKLTKGDKMELWSFRSREKLYFAMAPPTLDLTQISPLIPKRRRVTTTTTDRVCVPSRDYGNLRFRELSDFELLNLLIETRSDKICCDIDEELTRRIVLAHPNMIGNISPLGMLAEICAIELAHIEDVEESNRRNSPTLRTTTTLEVAALALTHVRYQKYQRTPANI